MSAPSRWLARAGLVGLGGAVGALARVWLEEHLGAGIGFAPGVLVANLTGTFLIGATLALASRLAPTSALRLRLLVATGVCGGLTTLSSLALVLAQTAEAGSWVAALANAALSLVGGVATFLVGRALALTLLARRPRHRARRAHPRTEPAVEVSDEH